jgi:hypothetical protein
MPQSRFLHAIAFLVALCSSSFAAAQTLDRGQVSGTVRDQTGAALDGVMVILRDVETGLARTAVTGADGRYAAPLMPRGTYLIETDRAGFAPAASVTVTLQVGQALVVNIEMKVAGVTAAVTVSAAGDTAPTLGTTIDRAAIQSLPIDGRDYRDFALLSPAVQSITGARGTFRVAGQPGDYLALHVDGADFTNNFFGEFFGSLERQNATIPLEAVQEFEVRAGGLGAQFGRSNGGLVNVVTKSGTNDRHGTLAYFLRHHEVTSKDAFGNAPAGLVRHAAGGSFGGPIVSDRTFYFLAADVLRQTTPITVAFARQVAGITVAELGIDDLGALEGQYPRREDGTTVLGKIDHRLTLRHRLSVRGLLTRSRGDNVGGGAFLLSQSASNLETFRNDGVSIVGSLNASVRERWVLETKVQTAGETRPRNPQGSGPQVQISDTGTFGPALFLPGTQDMYRYEVSQNVAVVRGRHDVSVGAGYNGFNMRNNTFALALNGAYTFPTLEAFVLRQPSLYAQNFGLNGLTAQDAALLKSLWQHEVAAHFQERFRPTARLTVGMGLRYDGQINPQPEAGIAGLRVPVGLPVRNGNQVELTYAPVPQHVPHDLDNWGPRGDVAYQLSDNGTAMVKAAAGLYYGRTPMIYFPIRGSGTTNTTLFAPPSRLGVTFPNVLPSAIVPGSPLASVLGPPAISYVDPEFNNPRVLHVNATVTRQFGGVWLESGYLFSDSRNLRIGGFRSTIWDRNVASPSEFDQFGRGVNVLASGRPDSTIAQANALTSFGRGRYQALLLSARRPMRDGWQFYANYTLAKSLGNASTERDTEALFGPADPFDPGADYGINELDERHQLKAFAVAMLPHRIALASTWSAGSGLAFPAYSAVDVNGDRATNDGLHPDRPAVDGELLPRFPYHQPAWFLWDVRVSKDLPLGRNGRVQVMLEVFNVLNRGNTYADPRTQAILGSPNFRVENRTLGPRLAQVGARIEF